MPEDTNAAIVVILLSIQVLNLLSIQVLKFDSLLSSFKVPACPSVRLHHHAQLTTMSLCSTKATRNSFSALPSCALSWSLSIHKDAHAQLNYGFVRTYYKTEEWLLNILHQEGRQEFEREITIVDLGNGCHVALPSIRDSRACTLPHHGGGIANLLQAARPSHTS